MRQFVASTLPDKKGCIVLTEKERRYLITVLRIKKGAEIEVRLPNGILCLMSVRFSSKKAGAVELVRIGQKQDCEIKKTVNTIGGKEYWLFQFLPKGQKMDLIVRQATECGVSYIVPIIGEYSVVGKSRDGFFDNANKVERWMRIVREAQQQSGSSIDTKVFPPCTLDDAMDLWQESSEKKNKENIGFMLCEKQDNQETLLSIIQKTNSFSNICIGFAVGCEGGISPAEVNILKEKCFQSIHFKTNILRAETAALYGIAALQTTIEEFIIWKALEE